MKLFQPRMASTRIFLILLSAFFSVFSFPGNKVSAQTITQTNSIYDSTAMMITLRTISMAAETYAQEHDVYPAAISDLINANPPYLSKEYCSETVWGYSYQCSFSSSGYLVTATPLSTSPADAPILTIQTDGILETQNKGEQKQAAPDFSFSAEDFWTVSQIDKYKRFLEQDPSNNQIRLVLANLYAGQGDGKTAQTLAEQIIAAHPDEATLEKAYSTLLLGLYLQAELDQGVKKTNEVLQLYPKNETVQSFQELFESLLEKRISESNVSLEAVPVSSNDVVSAEAPESEAVDKQAIGGVSLKPGEEDFVILDSVKIFFSSPPGWFKGANVHSSHGDSLIIYSKTEDAQMPVISITVDIPAKGIKSALQYSQWMKDETQKQFPIFEFSAPQEKNIAGCVGAYGELKVQSNADRSAWYQFLISGKIVTIQYSNTDAAFAADYPVFEAVVASMKVEKEKF